MEVARSDAKRAKGMMHRAEAPPGTGMLFVFEETADHSFWMFNCLIALDLVWLDERGKIVHIYPEAPPCPPGEVCPSYAPPRPARYVIEVAGGEAPRLGLVPGAQIVFQEMP